MLHIFKKNCYYIDKEIERLAKSRSVVIIVIKLSKNEKDN